MATKSTMSPLPAEELEAINTPRSPDAPRRCFICLTDEDPSDPPNSWVDACPCTLSAHQDCAVSWITDCERNGKPLLCPVCKYEVQLEEPLDPIVALSGFVHRRLTRASPLMLVTGLSLGVHIGLHAYGAMALWTFSGKEVLIRYVLGPQMQWHQSVKPSFVDYATKRLGSALMLVGVAPALLFGQLLPGASNKIFIPAASLYGMWHALQDPYFLTWPPSPQLALAMFPHIRSIYYNMWREFVYPYELKLSRQVLGLPPAGQDRNRGEAENGNNRRDHRADGGIAGFLQNVLDALGPDEDGHGGEAGNRVHIVNEEIEIVDEGGQDGELVVELVIDEAMEEEQGEEDADADLQLPADGAQAPPVVQEERRADQHEAPPAPPARRAGLGTILSAASNSIVSALMLPWISFAMGEALRCLVPRAWTAAPASQLYRTARLGFLQQQWGRSLLGGCLFVVMRDAVRLYTVYRKAGFIAQRKVKNVDRRRTRR